MAFQRKFANDVIVILSNPSGSFNQMFSGQEFTVTQHDGTDRPYRIVNESGGAIWVRPNEITLKPQVDTQVQAEVEEELDTAQFGKPEKKEVKKIDVSALYLSEMNLGERDKVKLEFVPTVEMAQNMGFHTDIVDHLKRHPDLNQYVGKEGVISYISPNAGYVSISFGKYDTKYFPALGVKVVEHVIPIAKFSASSDRVAMVYSNYVYLDKNEYTFEFFDKLYVKIKEYQKEVKTGRDRRINLDEGDYEEGVLHNTYIQVGCQQFSYENVKRLMAAIRLARSSK